MLLMMLAYRRWVILHCLHDLPNAVGADHLGHRSNRERLAWLGKDHGAREADQLAHHGINMHTLGLPLSMKYGRQSTEGYAHGSR